jgi:YVTN family beta-propeller protein
MIMSAAPNPLETRTGWLLVANKHDQSLGIIDPVSYTQIATVPVGGVTGHEVAVSPDGSRAFVPIFGDSGVGKPGSDGRHVAVIDLAARRVERMFAFDRGVRPHHAVVNPSDGLLYITTELENSVSIVDPNMLTLVGSVPTGQPESHMLAISGDGKRAYTANVGPGTVSVLDLLERTTIGVIPVAPRVQRIALSVDDRWAFTSDTTTPRLAIIDTHAHAVARWVALPAPGYGAAATTDGRHLIVAMPQADALAVIDLSTDTLSAVVATPRSPQEVLVRPDGRVAYVSCDIPGQVAAVDTAKWHVQAVIPAGGYADGLAWASIR